MRRRPATLLATAALLVFAGCTTVRNDMTGPVVGVPLDLPDHFMVAASGVGKAEEPKPDEGCRNPMVDPRDATLMTLMRSGGGKGDYAVQSEYGSGHKYGVTSRQLLRIDCATGKALGIVDQ
ncbi:MAG TPA: hypothetical protein VMN04_08150 [Thermoanaerobaculia bacterium]|nr:hypothetical protein [Thermoanaerobaculia bacterium]